MLIWADEQTYELYEDDASAFVLEDHYQFVVLMNEDIADNTLIETYWCSTGDGNVVMVSVISELMMVDGCIDAAARLVRVEAA